MTAEKTFLSVRFFFACKFQGLFPLVPVDNREKRNWKLISRFDLLLFPPMSGWAHSFQSFKLFLYSLSIFFSFFQSLFLKRCLSLTLISSILLYILYLYTSHFLFLSLSLPLLLPSRHNSLPSKKLFFQIEEHSGHFFHVNTETIELKYHWETAYSMPTTYCAKVLL